MKRLCKLLLCFLCAMVLSAPVSAQFASSIGGIATSYSLVGENKGEAGTISFVGTEMTPNRWADSTFALYLVVQNVDFDDPDAGGLGGKVVLASKTRWDGVYWLFGLGWIDDIIMEESGSQKGGFTFETGLSISVAKRFNVIVYGIAMDRGKETSIDIFLGVGIDNLWEFAGGIL